MKAVVFTLGCKVNSCESESLIAGLKSKGYETSEELCAADLYIINTCAVTAEAEKKIAPDDSAGAQIQRKREDNRHRVRLAESSGGLFKEKGRNFGYGREI